MTEPARKSSFSDFAPSFGLRLYCGLRYANKERTLRVGLFEGLRVAERQTWLFAQGRTRPGSKVTNASTVLTSWHGYGMGADIAFLNEAGNWYWPANEDPRWVSLKQCMELFGLTTGLNWKSPDAPHVQPQSIPATPPQADRDLLAGGAMLQVWAKYGLITLDYSILSKLDLKAS